jgi:hypothetical protein
MYFLTNRFFDQANLLSIFADVSSANSLMHRLSRLASFSSSKKKRFKNFLCGLRSWHRKFLNWFLKYYYSSHARYFAPLINKKTFANEIEKGSFLFYNYFNDSAITSKVSKFFIKKKGIHP